MARLLRTLTALGAIGFLAFLTMPMAFAQEVTTNTEEVGGVPTNVMMWSAIVGFLMPMVIAAINRYRWKSELKGITAFVACMIAAAGTAYFSGDLTQIRDFATAALFVFFSAIGSYNLWWKTSGISSRIEKTTG